MGGGSGQASAVLCLLAARYLSPQLLGGGKQIAMPVHLPPPICFPQDVSHSCWERPNQTQGTCAPQQVHILYTSTQIRS